jgi:enoyl-CoA hydratase/carnithine racemase
MDAPSDDDNLVLFESSAGVARITINREAKSNALSLATIARLSELLARAERDPSVKVVILSGVGEKAFAAGADLDELPGVYASAASAREYDDKFTAFYKRLEFSRLPVIARMAGAAISGGCLLALACDIRIAAVHVKVGFPVPRIGLMLSPHEYQLILSQMPLSRAKWLLCTGQMVSGDEAVRFGLIDQVVPSGRLDEVVDELARKIAQGAPLAVAASRRILNAFARHGGSESVIAESYRSVYPSRDLSEGLLALKEKRSPIFTGT